MKLAFMWVLGLALLPGAALGGGGGGSTRSTADPGWKTCSRPMHRYPGDLGGIARRAKTIFIGDLTSTTVKRDEDGLIVTENHFDVDRTILGQPARRVTLSTLGGTVGGKTLRVSHMPVFLRDRRYVVFVDPGRGAYNPVVGNEGGVFVVGPDSGIYTLAGVAVADVEGGRLRLGRALLAPGHVTPASPRERPDVYGDVIATKRRSRSNAPPMSVDSFVAAIAALTEAAR